MTFSENQVRQLYVATAVKSSVAATDTAGTIAVKTDTAKTHLYFQYKGADNLMRSDLFDPKSILDAKVTPASALASNLKVKTLVLDPTVNGGNPIAGQDYVLRISFRQYLGMSDEDQYFKYGLVHAYSGMTASDFYKVLAISLVKNFSREATPLVSFQLKALLQEGDPGPALVDVTNQTKLADLDGTYQGVVINEVAQEWVRGIKEQVPVYFEVYPTTVLVDGDQRVWGTVTASTGDSIGDGKKIADLEYFLMGERGDQYRNINWPNSIPTVYLVDPSKDYHILDIHYAYTGSNEGVQKSEKTISIVCADKTAMNGIITAFNTATGLSVASIA